VTGDSVEIDSTNGEKPKVLMLLTNPFLPDPRVLKEARSLSRDYDVTIWAVDTEGVYPQREQQEGFRIERVNLAVLNPIRPLLWRLHMTLVVETALFFLRSFRLLRREFQLIHVHDLIPLALGLFLGKLKRARVIFDAHEDFAAQMSFVKGRLIVSCLSKLENWLMRYVDAVIVVGEIMGKDYRKRTKKKIQVIGNWNDSRTFQKPSPNVINSNVQRARSQGKLIVSYLAGIGQNRIVLPLLEAAKEDSDVFVIVAGGRDGNPLALRVKRTMAKLPNALYLGWLEQNKLNAYFSYTDVVYYCLHPADPNNRYYAGNTIFSALSAGKAIITTDIGEVGHMVKMRDCGVVMRDASRREILRAFDGLKDREHLNTFQLNATRTSEFYCWDRAEKGLLELYAGLLNGPLLRDVKADSGLGEGGHISEHHGRVG
jgi:glycosyltransferase involved in cell wall biosynthesis